MPVHIGYDDKGKFYQWGSQAKYYISEHGEDGAREKAYAQESAIEHSGYTEKNFNSFAINNTDDFRVMRRFDPYKGDYFVFGMYGTPFYVSEYGEERARSMAMKEAHSLRLRYGIF
jgi:hypothetical protein